MAISMLKIRRPLGRLIFNMEIAIPGKTVFLIETAPRQFNTLFTEFNRYIYIQFHHPWVLYNMLANLDHQILVNITWTPRLGYISV